jgi:hypothetical protein
VLRACQLGKRTLFLKEEHDEGGIESRCSAGARRKVEDGLKGIREGIRSAFRFEVMVSSVEARERRRKSMCGC